MNFAQTLRFFIDEAVRFVSPLSIAIQWEIVLVAAILLWLAPRLFGNWLRPPRASFRRLANRRGAAVLACGIFPIAIRLLLLGIYPVPDPSIHDEFSHLLLADTLAHGRLTNPPHPMWQHFESIHIIQQPTYNSMYPPGFAAFLAFGQRVFHEPWAGVVLSVGLMFAAMCWMMQAWLPPQWALFGTLLAILAFGITSLWMNSYLGGAVPGLGGALVMGSVQRLRRGSPGLPKRIASGPVFLSVLLGVGIVLLMNTRPFEGAVLTGAALVYLLIGRLQKLHKKLMYRRISWVQIAAPAGLILTAGLAFTAYYNWRVTGNPTRLPYEVNRETYGWPENLGILPAKQVTFRHAVLRDMYQKEIAHHGIYSTWYTFFDSLDLRAYENWSFFCGPALTIPLLLLPAVFRDRRTRPLVVILALMLALNLFQMVLYPYHLGPIVAILFAIIAQGARHIYILLSRTNAIRGMAFAALLPLCVVLASTMKLEAADLSIPVTYWENGSEPHRDIRAGIQAWLERQPGKQLVLVHYETFHTPDQEWVYNGANIDNSKVVWAREMNPDADAKLVGYFKDRKVWWLNADAYPQRVVAYPYNYGSCRPESSAD